MNVFNWQDEIFINLVTLAAVIMLIKAKPAAIGDNVLAVLIGLIALCSFALSL
jgi:hypothetical protein